MRSISLGIPVIKLSLHPFSIQHTYVIVSYDVCFSVEYNKFSHLYHLCYVKLYYEPYSNVSLMLIRDDRYAI